MGVVAVRIYSVGDGGDKMVMMIKRNMIVMQVDLFD